MENSGKKTCRACSTESKIGNGNIYYTEIINCAEYINTGVCQKCKTNYKLVDNSGTKECSACSDEDKIRNGNVCYTAITNCAEDNKSVEEDNTYILNKKIFDKDNN